MRNTRNNYEEPSAWPSISDMMAGLMVIFLFIGIAFMLINKGQMKILKEQDTKVDKILAEYDGRRHEIGQAMWKRMGKDLDNWEADLDTNKLRIRFQGENTKFAPKSAQLPTGFMKVLYKFIPEFLAIISDPDFDEDIEEIRIEGHSFEDPNTTWKDRFTISQSRSKAVLIYLRNHPAYQDLPPTQKAKLDFKVSAVGLGDAKMIDNKGEYVFHSKRRVCPTCSRRVEFSIITSSDRVFDNLRFRE